MKAVRVILLLLVAVVAVCAGLAATKPNTFHVERSATIAAPPATVFAAVNDFHQWPGWSPWEHLDPAMKKEFSGAQSGPGAQYAWSGNDKVGSGRMTIVGSTPDSRVDIKLEFLKPFTATNQTEFAFEPEGAGTKVTWSINGPMNFVSKVMCLFQDMDHMLGPDFVKGLAQLKTVAESAPPAAADSTAAPPTKS